MKRFETLIANILREYSRYLKVSYAVLCDRGRKILVVKFSSKNPDERFRLRLDLVTLLPPIPIDVYDADQLHPQQLLDVLKHGTVIYVEDYDEYLEDLVRCSKDSSGV